MKKVVFASVLALSLTGCGGNADGTYVAMIEGGFLKSPLPIVLEVKGDKAVMNVADMKKISMTASLDGKVLSLHEGNPQGAINFHIINDGHTLQCNQCEQVGIPKMWEKKS